MKPSKYILLPLMILLMAVFRISAQGVNSPTIEVTFNKTSSVIFPAAITSVDRGSRDILAQRAKGVNNILQLKAGTLNFKETNLTVITADGNLHHFFVKYSDKPSRYTVNIGISPLADSNQLLFQSEMTEADLKQLSEEILSREDDRKIKSYTKYDMKLLLRGIYIEDNVMFFHLSIENKSNIPYHNEVLRFSIRDKRQSKRTASQEVSEAAIHQTGDASMIDGKSSNELVFAIPKFTIPDAKLLRIELKEKRGGRHLFIDVKNNSIIKARRVKS